MFSTNCLRLSRTLFTFRRPGDVIQRHLEISSGPFNVKMGSFHSGNGFECHSNWSRQWLVAYSAPPSHCLKQRWLIINCKSHKHIPMKFFTKLKYLYLKKSIRRCPLQIASILFMPLCVDLSGLIMYRPVCARWGDIWNAGFLQGVAADADTTKLKTARLPWPPCCLPLSPLEIVIAWHVRVWQLSKCNQCCHLWLH